jgi:hypothetical protein
MILSGASHPDSQKVCGAFNMARAISETGVSVSACMNDSFV